MFSPNEDESYTVTFPDIKGCITEGKTIDDAVSMANDALCSMLYYMEESKKTIPAATKPNKVKAPEGGFCSVISVDTEIYRRYYNNKAVKKTLTIPAWLNERADEMVSRLMHEMNLSSVRSDAKKNYIRFNYERKKDALQMNFSTTAPHNVWVSDVTFSSLGRNSIISVQLLIYTHAK